MCFDCVFAEFYLFTCCDAQDIAQEAAKKRRRATKKPYSRSIVGATLEVIQKKRSEKPEVRDAAREAALRCVFFDNAHVLLVFASESGCYFSPTEVIMFLLQ